MNVIEPKEKIKDLKVLFVDDEVEICESTIAFLNKFFDRVFVASDGLEALEIFEAKQGTSEQIDIVISDILMPRMDGATMAKKMLELSKDLFVVFVTATRDDIKDPQLQSKLLVKKPVSYNSILEIIESIEKYFNK